MNKTLGVALVGVGPDQWSAIGHIPALEGSDGVELVRLVTSNAMSAGRAGRQWGVPAGDSLEEALADEAVDVVTITLRVAKHADIAIAAMEAGKHVYCEWPLALNLDEAQRLAEVSAKHPEALHMVGLQGRLLPELKAAAEAAAAGAIGTPIGASIRVFLSHGLHPRPRHRAHLRHRTAAANVLTIQGGHTLDMLVSLLGEPGRITFATLWTAVNEFIVAETGERLPRDAPDNVAAFMDVGGVPLMMELSHTSARESTVIDITGSNGSIHLEGAGQPQMGPLDGMVVSLDAGREALAAPHSVPGIRLDRSHPGFGVALAYRELVESVAAGEPTPDFPSFERGVAVHEGIAAIERQTRA